MIGRRSLSRAILGGGDFAKQNTTPCPRQSGKFLPHPGQKRSAKATPLRTSCPHLGVFRLCSYFQSLGAQNLVLLFFTIFVEFLSIFVDSAFSAGARFLVNIEKSRNFVPIFIITKNCDFCDFYFLTITLVP